MVNNLVSKGGQNLYFSFWGLMVGVRVLKGNTWRRENLIFLGKDFTWGYEKTGDHVGGIKQPGSNKFAAWCHIMTPPSRIHCSTSLVTCLEWFF